MYHFGSVAAVLAATFFFAIKKVWSSGEWEPMGEIVLRGSNKTFCANTRQKKAGY